LYQLIFVSSVLVSSVNGHICIVVCVFKELKMISCFVYSITFFMLDIIEKKFPWSSLFHISVVIFT
jgi:hypothetical protein